MLWLATVVTGLSAAPFAALKCLQEFPPGMYLLYISLFCAPVVLAGMVLVEILRCSRMVAKPFSNAHLHWGVDLRGRICIVTGCNTGIGYQTAANLAALGATVIMACRSKERAAAAMSELEKEREHSSALLAREGRFVVEELDLSSLASVRAFATRFKENFGNCCDVLVNNAGINGATAATLGSVTRDGYETCFQVNYLGHFYLTLLLLPSLQHAARQRGSESRIVCLSSVMHHFSSSDVQASIDAGKRGLVTGGSRYNESKLFMLLLAFGLQLRNFDGVRAVAANPGAVRSDIWRAVPPLILPAYDLLMRVLFLSTSQGCATSVAAAAAPPKILPKDALYLSPYRCWGNFSLPFDLLGPYAGGLNSAKPHLPKDVDLHAELLWSESISMIKSKIGQDAELPSFAT